ncbi:hypothetical protein [Stutzerimonas frequens]|uniref:DUF4376 domain-containing protein n=1 Tax=Stutzerimonas frequens TaxID=2968969 RepID=UPI00190B8FB8|nr:hypothetical protein [Stutzerimonas frequens]
MSLFATWNELDQRFAFSLVKGEIEITQDEHHRLIAGQGTGQAITKGPDGRPTLTVRDQPSEAEAAHANRTAAINRACEAAITAGFTSEALGAPHIYSSQLDDQLNLTGAVLRGLDMPYACRDEQGVKEFRLHTADQLRQVGDDFTLYKLQLLQHANALKQQLDAALEAGDLAALESITWEAPQP